MTRKTLEVDAARQGGTGEVVAALGISLTAVVSGRAQIVFQTHVPQDADPAGVNELLDRWGAVLARQTAKGEIDDIRAELLKHRTALSHALADKAEIDEAKQLDVVRLGLEIETLRADQEKNRDDAYKSFTARGRQGEAAQFKLQGAAKANNDRIESAIVGIGKQIETIKGERAAAESNFKTTISRFEEEIARLEAKEQETLKLINGD